MHLQISLRHLGAELADNFDAIFIGAGHNALAGALHLATKGWRVGLFEQAPEPGGAIKSGAYTLPGFQHDWAAMNLSLFAGSGFFKDYSAELIRHGLEFVPISAPFASAFPDGRWLGVTTDLAQTSARIAAFSAQDAATWQRLFADFPTQARDIFGLLNSPMKLRALAYFVFKILRARGIAGTFDFARFLLTSPRQWLTTTFESPQLHAMLGAWGMHLDFAPEIAGGALFPYLEAMAGQAYGMVIGKSGAATVVSALVNAIGAHGGVIECNARVSKILHAADKATGIELADGRRFTAGKAVIAGIAPAQLSRLTGAMTPAFDDVLQRFDHAPGTMMIHLALDSALDWAAGNELKSFAYVQLSPSLDQMARTYQQARAGLLPDEPVLVVGQPSAHDKSRAPEGKHTLWLQVRMVPGVIKGDARGEIAVTDWTQAAGPFAARVIEILEGYAPGTKAKILWQRIVTPAELEQENPNLIGGDQLCGSHHLSQHFVFRPAYGHADGSTPIHNLFLTGAAVWPGAGTGAGSGYHLARKLAGN